MFAQLTANDIQSKSDNNNSPMIRFEKQQSFVQKYQINNVTHHHNNNNGNSNRKKFQKVPTISNNNNNNNNNNTNNNSSNNKNHHNNNNNSIQSYSTTNNSRKKSNHQFNSTCTTNKPPNIINNNNNNNNNNTNNNNNNNTNGIKNQNISYTPTTKGTVRNTAANPSVKNNTNNNNNNIICSDQALLPNNNRCDTLVSKNIASDINSTTSTKPTSSSSSTFQHQKPATSSNLLVSSSSSLSLSSPSSSLLFSSSSISFPTSTSTTVAAHHTGNSTNNNRNRIANQRFASNQHRKKLLQASELNNQTKSPIPIMVVGNGNVNQQQQQQQQQLPTVFTTPICTTSSAPSSAPVSPCSYSLNFLHSVGVQMTGGSADNRHPNMVNGHHQHHHHHHHVYSSSATVSPAGSTQNMLIQGQRIIYQDIPPPPLPEKRNLNNNNNNNNNNGQRKFSPKVQSPSFAHRSYDIPILINNNINHSVGDHFSSPYNYPPLNSNNNNYKRNSYIPLSYPYQKSQNDNNSYPNGPVATASSAAHTPTFNRNRNQSKAWNNNNGGLNAHTNTSNGSMSKHNSDYANSQMNSRVKNHQNISNLTYVTTAAANTTTDPHESSSRNLHLNGNRSQSSSPKIDFPHPPPPPPPPMSNKQQRVLNHVGPTITKGDSFSPGNGDDNTQLHQRVASEGYESDSSNSSCGKRTSTGHSNFLSSSSSSLSSTEISYHPPPPPLNNLPHNFNFPSSFAEDDAPPQHFYGSEQNLSQWIPALHAQFMYSAHGIFPPNGTLTEFQQQQIKKSQTNRSSYRGGRDRFLGRSHVAEVREAPRSLLNGSKWDNLSQGIWNKFVNAQQTEDTFKRKMRLWRYLYIIVKNSYPRLGLYLVGSTMSGFGADSSDIDMCLVSKAFSTIDPRMEALFNLTLLRDCLMKTGEFEKFNLIEAKVPILRFKDRVHNLEVDLNFNNCVGIKNTHLLFCYSQLDWRLRPLVLVTKLWAQYHNINNAKNMTISSYSLVLMVIHFLQCAVSPPVLPCLHELYPDKFHFLHRTNDFGCVDMNETIGPFDSQNNQPIGQLFLEFLQYYSNFNYSQFAISIRTGALIPIEYCRQAKSIKNDIHQWKELCIEEPFDLTNTARSVYDSETFERVKLVFVSSYKALQETLDINSIFTPLVPTGPVQENK